MTTKIRLLHDTVGIPTGAVAVTQSASDNTTKVATTAYVTTALANLADSAPSTLNTLNELAAALGDDANFSTTVTNSIAAKLPLAGGALTGSLDISGGTVNGTSFADNKLLRLQNTSTTDGSRMGIAFQGNSSIGSGLAWIEGVNYDQSIGATDIRFSTYSGSAWNGDMMTLSNNGKVGIGITSPTTKLEILDANSVGLRFGDIASTPSSQTAGYIGMSTSAYSGNNGDLVLIPRTSATSNILLMEGNVGIGMTPAPVGSDTVLSIYNSATPRIKLHNNTTGSASGDGGEINMSGNIMILENRENAEMRFYTNGAERIQISNNGNLEFKSTTSSFTGASSFTNHTNGYLYLRGGTSGLRLDDDSSVNTIQIVDGSSGYIKFETGDGSERMRIDNAGNVGIGETSPSTSLHVSKGTNGSGLIDVARFENQGTTVNDGARIQLTAGASTSGAGIGCLGDALNSAHLVFHAGGNTERMRIRSDGGIQYATNNTLIATGTGSSVYEWGAFRRPASNDGGQLTVRQYSSGDTAANYPAYASSNGSGTWDENTGVYFPELDQVGLTANGNPTLTIEDGRKIEIYENGFTSGDANRGQRVCLGGISHIANTNPGGTGSGTYLHIKTNLPKQNIMFRFEYKGLSYDSQNMDTSIIGYTYTGVSYVHSPQIQDTGNSTYRFYNPYYSSDSKLVLVLQIANNYTGGILWAQFVGSHTMAPGTIAIASCAYSNSTSGAF